MWAAPWPATALSPQLMLPQHAWAMPPLAMPVAMPASTLPASPPVQHVFAAPPATPMAMTPLQMAQFGSLLAAEVSRPPTIPLHPQNARNELAAALRKEPAKQKTPEREYTADDLRCMAREVLDGTAPSLRSAAIQAGFPQAAKTLGRYVKAIKDNKTLQRSTAEETLQAQLDYVDNLQFKMKGNVDLTSRRLFSDDELDWFASALKLYGDMGWPMDYQQIRVMFSQAAAKMKRVDWKSGQDMFAARHTSQNSCAGVRSSQRTRHLILIRSARRKQPRRCYLLACVLWVAWWSVRVWQD
jgi:hypothetical protein